MDDQRPDKKTTHLKLDNFPPRAEIFQEKKAMDETFDRELGKATNKILKTSMGECIPYKVEFHYAKTGNIIQEGWEEQSIHRLPRVACKTTEMV